jgi:hypothetical protein
MHPETLAALVRLAEVLTANPADAAALAVYGSLPEHLADAIEDHEPEAEG